MKTKINYLLVLVLASFVFAGCTTTISGSCKAKQWEYKSVPVSVPEIELSQLGKDGWELVAVAPVNLASGPSQIYIFKRPLN